MAQYGEDATVAGMDGLLSPDGGQQSASQGGCCVKHRWQQTRSRESDTQTEALVLCWARNGAVGMENGGPLPP